MQSPIVQKTADIAGAVLSQLCLVHCLLLPVLLAVLPSLSPPDFLGGEAFHLAVLLLATPVALFAFQQGYQRHACSKPAVFGVAALSVLWLVFCLEESIPHDLVAAFNVMAGLLMASAHWQNWSLSRESCVCHH